MKIYRNLTTIRNKEKRGRRLSLIGLGILMIGLLASFVPTWLPPDEPATTPLTQFFQQYWMWISFVALPVGFIFASFGSYYINRFARRRWKGTKVIARPDELLERSLKGFDNKYAYFAWSLPAQYVLVGPCGVIIFAARSDRGRVTVQGDKWREPFSIGRIFTIFAREGLGNPSGEVEEQANKLRALLTVNGSGEEENTQDGNLDSVPITGAAVFLSPEVLLTVDNPNIPALRAEQVKEFVRRQARELKLPAHTVRTLTDRLVEAADYDEE
jgi:MFS family permease